jgi:hypothetical protein
VTLRKPAKASHNGRMQNNDRAEERLWLEKRTRGLIEACHASVARFIVVRDDTARLVDDAKGRVGTAIGTESQTCPPR